MEGPYKGPFIIPSLIRPRGTTNPAGFPLKLQPRDIIMAFHDTMGTFSDCDTCGTEEVRDLLNTVIDRDGNYMIICDTCEDQHHCEQDMMNTRNLAIVHTIQKQGKRIGAGTVIKWGRLYLKYHRTFYIVSSIEGAEGRELFHVDHNEGPEQYYY